MTLSAAITAYKYIRGGTITYKIVSNNCMWPPSSLLTDPTVGPAASPGVPHTRHWTGCCSGERIESRCISLLIYFYTIFSSSNLRRLSNNYNSPDIKIFPLLIRNIVIFIILTLYTFYNLSIRDCCHIIIICRDIYIHHPLHMYGTYL